MLATQEPPTYHVIGESTMEHAISPGLLTIAVATSTWTQLIKFPLDKGSHHGEAVAE